MSQQVALRLPANVATTEVVINPTATPSVNPETLSVTQRTLISFRIAAEVRSSYVFATQPAPIVVSNGAGGFDAPVRRSDSWVTMVDLATVKGDFKYTVNLINTSTGQLVSIDPYIRNEN